MTTRDVAFQARETVRYHVEGALTDEQFLHELVDLGAAAAEVIAITVSRKQVSGPGCGVEL